MSNTKTPSLLGQSLSMDFINISNSKQEIFIQFEQTLTEILKSPPTSKSSSEYLSTDETINTEIILFSLAYASISYYNKAKSITFEVRLLYNDQSDRDIILIETAFGDKFGWSSLSGDAFFQRGGSNYHLLNKYYHSETLYKNFNLIHREQSKYQDLRVYDTKDMGRLLCLDYMIQNSDIIATDNYTIDLCSLVLTNKEKEYDHILLIGSGDLIFPEYMLREFKIKKITLVEIDERVIENTKTYFKYYEGIKKYVNDGTLEIIVDDGAAYLQRKALNNEMLYDGVIIDNSDVYLFDGPAANLFTKDFYYNIKTVLKTGGSFSQQVSDEQVKSKWIQMVKSAGFDETEFSFKSSITPEYSTALPLGAARKKLD